MIQPPSCLYNCGSGAPSTNEYHLLPFSASTLELTLPPGVVCDHCNAYFSKLESHFTQHHPGSSARMVSIRATRRRKPPSIDHQHGKVTARDFDGRRQIKMNLDPRSVQFDMSVEGELQIRAGYTPKPFDAAKVSRVLHKIAFERLVLVDKPGFDPRSGRFDPMRDYVRRPKKRSEFIPFKWLRGEFDQQRPVVMNWENQKTGKSGDVCQISFPGIIYLVAYPPWPTPDVVWDYFDRGQLVDRPGMIPLDPEIYSQKYVQMSRAEYANYRASHFDSHETECSN